MASFEFSPEHLTLRLSWWEKIAARRSNLTVPRRAVNDVRAVSNVFDLPDLQETNTRGQQATHVRRLLATGTLDGTEAGPVFVLCHRRGITRAEQQPGLVIDLEGATIGRIIVTGPVDAVKRWEAEGQAWVQS